MRRTPALIVGGGPAGSAAAIMLARHGVETLLVERDAAPRDALCGGFLSWKTLAALHRLGVDAMALGGHPIAMVRVFVGARRIEARLPGRAVGLSRLTLDAALLARAAAAGAGIERGVGVRAVDYAVPPDPDVSPRRRESSLGSRLRGSALEGEATRSDETHLRLDDGATIAADALFLATGKHELRGVARPRDAAGSDPALGLRFRLAASPRLAAAVADAVELHLFDGGYAGLELQEGGDVNLCMAARRSRLVAAGGRPEALLALVAGEAPVLADRLGAARAIGEAQAVAHVPYGWRARRGAAGLFRLGDQAAVIPSLAGEGVGIALASGMMAADAFARGGAAGAPDYQRRLARRLSVPFAVAGGLRAVAEAPGRAAAWLAFAALAPGAIGKLASLTRIG